MYRDCVLTSVPGSKFGALLLGGFYVALLVAGGQDVGSAVPGGEFGALLLWGLDVTLVVRGGEDVCGWTTSC